MTARTAVTVAGITLLVAILAVMVAWLFSEMAAEFGQSGTADPAFWLHLLWALAAAGLAYAVVARLVLA